MTELADQYFKKIGEADKLLKRDDLEGAIEKYADAFKIRQLLESKGMLYSLLKKPISCSSVDDHVFAAEVSGIYGFFLRCFGREDRSFDKRFVKIIALHYLLLRDKRALKKIERYNELGKGRLEQKILAGLLYDAVSRKELADGIYLDIYRMLRSCGIEGYEALPTIRKKVYEIKSVKLLNNLYLFKEDDDYTNLLFEARCSSLIRQALYDRPMFDVSCIREPIEDSETGVYVSLIRREKCDVLGDVNANRAELFKMVTTSMALMHIRLRMHGLRQRSLDDFVNGLKYSQEIKDCIRRNKLPLEEALIQAPIAYHKDSHPSNYGVTNDGRIIIFDCENKGLRHVTSDLAKLLLIGKLDENDLQSCLKNYMYIYNLNIGKEHDKIFDIYFPFLNSSIEVALSYPSALSCEQRRFTEVRKQLFEEGRHAIRCVKENFGSYYARHEAAYRNLDGVFQRLLC